MGALASVVSQGASLNVLEVIARGNVRVLSLMHSERYFEHAWRYWRCNVLLNRVALRRMQNAQVRSVHASTRDQVAETD